MRVYAARMAELFVTHSLRQPLHSCGIMVYDIVIPVDEGLSLRMLACRQVKELRTRPGMSIKAERMLRDMRMLSEDCGSAQHGAICYNDM